MAPVAFAVAALALAALVVREVMWRRAEALLRRRIADLRAELGDHEHRAQVHQVVSGLAQELKSPLQGVLGNTELILASGGLSGASADDVLQIQQHATHAAGIVRNLVAFTETNALIRRWQDINALATRAAEGVRGDLESAGVALRLSLADHLPLLYVDGRQLEKVIATLLSRRPIGADLAAAVPAVTLATRRGGADDRLVIDIDDRSSDGDEPAWSGDLAACREIVQAHGGSLEVERAADGVFRFHLELPVAAAGGGPAAPAS